MGKTEKNYCLFKKFPQGPIVKSVNFLDGSIVVKHLAKKKIMKISRVEIIKLVLVKYLLQTMHYIDTGLKTYS